MARTISAAREEALGLSRRRRLVQLGLWPVMVLTLVLGWRYPWLGFTVPLVMLLGLVVGFFRGRYVCGHLCPRGAFFDRVMSRLSRGRPIPGWFRHAAFRWTLLAALMGFMVYRLSLDPGNWEHWGRVFWLMCALTSAVGIVLAVFIHPRSWCTFCPMGTMQAALDRGRPRIAIDSASCVGCRACEKACPMNLSIVSHREQGHLPDRDCLKCPECRSVCPRDSLRLA
jgi:polyferredoxin